MTLDLDGTTWTLRFAGWDAPLGVETAEGFGWLRPWSLALHLPALAAATRPGKIGPELDEAQFAAAVLAACWPGEASAELEALALWWASAPGAATPDRDGWLSCGVSRARLRPWTWGARAAALGQSLGDEGLDLATFLGAQIEACVVAVEPEGTVLHELPAGPVLAGLVTLHATPRLPPDIGPATLRAATALGWLPGQVLAAPAPEIDLLLELLDAAPPPTSRPTTFAPGPRWSGLAAWPDAVVIQVEDE